MADKMILLKEAQTILRDRADALTVSMFATSGECHAARVAMLECASLLSDIPPAKTIVHCKECRTIDAVPRDEYDMLLARFRHLLKSDFIRSFDEYDRKTHTYKRDIAEADKYGVEVVRCRDCRYRGISVSNPEWGWMYCHRQAFAKPFNPDFYCAYGEKMNAEVEG